MAKSTYSATTPLFFIWSLQHSCPVKDVLDCDSEQPNLLQLERAMRPLRSLAEANAYSRTHGDLCMMDPPVAQVESVEAVKAFSATEVMDAFGGEEYLSANCDRCPANAYHFPGATDPPCGKRQFAGCYGYLQSQYDDFRLFDWWQQQFDQDPDQRQEAPKNEIRDIWIAGGANSVRTLQRTHRDWLLKLLAAVPTTKCRHPDLRSLLKALEYSRSSDTEVKLQVVPQGFIDGNHWLLPQHCSVCIHPIEKWMGQCPECRTTAAPNSKRKRLLRGDRPYWPLVRFLGKEKAIKVAEQYFDQSGSKEEAQHD